MQYLTDPLGIQRDVGQSLAKFCPDLDSLLQCLRTIPVNRLPYQLPDIDLLALQGQLPRLGQRQLASGPQPAETRAGSVPAEEPGSPC